MFEEEVLCVTSNHTSTYLQMFQVAMLQGPCHFNIHVGRSLPVIILSLKNLAGKYLHTMVTIIMINQAPVMLMRPK